MGISSLLDSGDVFTYIIKSLPNGYCGNSNSLYRRRLTDVDMGKPFRNYSKP